MRFFCCFGNSIFVCKPFIGVHACRADKALYDSLEGHEVWISDHLPANRVDRILKK